MRFTRVLHPTDFSKASAAAFAQAVETARENRAELTIAHVLPMIVAGAADGYLPPATYEQIERSNRAYAERRISALVRGR